MHEFELINKLTHGTPKSGHGFTKGVGDDCAVIEAQGKDMLVTTDALFEGVHFKREWISPRTLGRKALSVNVSDIAAMGGRPLYYLVSVGIPKEFPLKDVEQAFEGMAQVAASFRMALIGGDTCASGQGLLLSLTAIGEIDKGKAIFRSGAAPGDSVFVTGTVGDSAVGLACLEKGIRNIEMREFIRKHDDPTPRVATGQWLAASSCVSSMIDISDGLAADIGHISEASGVGIRLFADLLPISKNFRSAAQACNKDPIVLALTGGEEYELAFTVAKHKLPLFEKMLSVVGPTFGHQVTKIGEVVEGSGVIVMDVHGTDVPIGTGGFEHKF